MSIDTAAKAAAGRFDTNLGIQHHFSEGVYAKQMHLPKGFKAYSHKHAYAHLSILAKGRAKVATDTESTVYDAPACIEIKAGVHHEIEALEDVTWFCIHATDDKDPDHIDQVSIGA